MEKELRFYGSTSRDFALVKTGASNMMMKWKRGNSESYVNLFSFDNAGTFTSTKSQRVTVSSYGYTDLIKGPGNL